MEWAPERSKSGAWNWITVLCVIVCLVMVGLMIKGINALYRLVVPKKSTRVVMRGDDKEN